MAIKTIKQWYFSKGDKEQIKSSSKDISKIFKIGGYKPSRDHFEDYFSLEDFDFIPCIRDALDYADDEEEIQVLQQVSLLDVSYIFYLRYSYILYQ